MGKGKSQLVLLKDPTTFSLQNGGSYYMPTQQPPTDPIINAGTSTAYRERLYAETTENHWNWQTYKHYERICVKQMTKSIEPMYYA